MQQKLNGQYVSNLPQSLKSGGWSGMNINIYKQLSSHFKLEYLPPIQPAVLMHERLKSKLLSLMGLKRHFEFFSERRLQMISNQFQINPKSNVDFLFFHGTTPWIKCKPQIPYFAYVDATFLTYSDIYLNPKNFLKSEITRIVNQEKQFLAKASTIFFSSEWAKQETMQRYNMDGSNFQTVGLGGNTEIPQDITPSNELNLLFVSMDFKRKGGQIAFDGFVKLKQKFPELTLHIIGDAPPKNIINTPGIIFHGFIDKKTEEGRSQFDKIFKSAAFLIHPTEKDMTPLIIVEAGYYGIPAVAPAKFGIPEMIKDGKTGYLLKQNTPDEIVSILNTVLAKPNQWQQMQQATYHHMLDNFTWNNTGNKIINAIERKTN